MKRLINKNKIDEREYQFNKALADVEYLHNLAVTFSISFTNKNYRVATESLLLWAASIKPLVEEKELGQKYVERIDGGMRKLDHFSDNKNNQALSAAFNNFLVRLTTQKYSPSHAMPIGL